MQIIDLTQGKYPIADAFMGIRLDKFVLSCQTYRGPFNKSFLFNSHNAGTIQQKQYCFLQKVPIFLVDTSMSGTKFLVPETGMMIDIPLDNYSSFECKDKDDEDLDFFRKLLDRNTREDNESEDKKGKLVPVIYDYLAVYVASAVQDDVPARIFIWIDKVCGHTRQKKLQRALLEQVILHEYGHALLDVCLYGFGHTSLFSYSDYPYRYLEEMCANAFSLHYGNRHWDKKQMAFIEKFVKSQPKEYAAGWHLCNVFHPMDLEDGVLEFWMWSKIYLDEDIIKILDWFWKDKDYKIFLSHRILKFLSTTHAKIVLGDSCGKNYWEYRDLSNDKIGIVKIERQTHYVTDAKYDSVWSFDENGLCMVRIDHHYGYVNTSGIEQIPIKYDYIYSFENGLTIAKQRNEYCIIDENDNFIKSLNPNYKDVRAFRDGYATMEDISGHWGAIDYQGNEIIPCKYDSQVIFDKNGIAEVELNNQIFRIDVNDNIIVNF